MVLQLDDSEDDHMRQAVERARELGLLEAEQQSNNAVVCIFPRTHGVSIANKNEATPQYGCKP